MEMKVLMNSSSDESTDSEVMTPDAAVGNNNETVVQSTLSPVELVESKG